MNVLLGYPPWLAVPNAVCKPLHWVVQAYSRVLWKTVGEFANGAGKEATFWATCSCADGLIHKCHTHVWYLGITGASAGNPLPDPYFTLMVAASEEVCEAKHRLTDLLPCAPRLSSLWPVSQREWCRTGGWTSCCAKQLRRKIHVPQ